MIPFGVMNAPNIFMYYTYMTFHHILDKFFIGYIDYMLNYIVLKRHMRNT